MGDLVFNNCLSDYDFQVRDTLVLIAYTINFPIYLIIGVGGNAILLVAFYKQSKKEKTYAYQVFLCVSKVLEVSFTCIFMMTFKWGSGIDTNGAAWFKKNYFLMFYAAHLAVPIFDGFIILSLYLSVAMAADRVFALTKPIAYKTINHGRHQAVAVVASILIAVLFDIFEVKEWKVMDNPNGDGYQDGFDNNYLATTLAMVLGNVRVGVRILGLMLLIVFNLMLAFISRKRAKKVATITAGSSDQKEQKRKAADRAILVLTITQSCLLIFGQLPHTCHLCALTFPGYGDCIGQIVSPSVDICIELADIIDFFVIVSINKRIRRTVGAVIPCTITCGGNNSSSVMPVSGTNIQSRQIGQATNQDVD